MFHWQDNIFFGRKSDGSVRVLQFKRPMANPSPDGLFSNALIDLTIPAEHWASITASVSHAADVPAGRPYERSRAAR